MNARTLTSVILLPALTLTACLPSDYDQPSDLTPIGDETGDFDESQQPDPAPESVPSQEDGTETGGGSSDSGGGDALPHDPNVDYAGRIMSVEGTEGDVWIHSMPSQNVAADYPDAGAVAIHLQQESMSIAVYGWDGEVLDVVTAQLDAASGTYPAQFPGSPEDDHNCTYAGPCPPPQCEEGDMFCDSWIATTVNPDLPGLSLHGMIGTPFGWDVALSPDGELIESVTPHGGGADFPVTNTQLSRVTVLRNLVADADEVLAELGRNDFIPPVAVDVCNGREWSIKTMSTFGAAVCCGLTGLLGCLACAGLHEAAHTDAEDWDEENCGPLVPEGGFPIPEIPDQP